MKKDVKLYNLIFPFYIVLFFFPRVAVFTLLGNFIIDSIVLLIISKAVYKRIIGRFYIKTIWKVWLLGFLSDIIGVVFLLFSYNIFPQYYSHLKDKSLTGDIARGLSSAHNGYAFLNIWSFLITFSAVLISGILIFIFNYFISFRKADMTKKQKILSALAYAVFTAPYTIFI